MIQVVLEAPHIAAQAKPGQFVMVYMPGDNRYMLPRPLSLFNVDRVRGEVTLMFEIKGRGTALLAASSESEQWKMLGPLGSGFPALPERSLLVGGGLGIAPLVFLAATSQHPLKLIYAARTNEQLFCPDENLQIPGVTILEVTEDGSRGSKGLATDLVNALVDEVDAVFACGPRPMLAAISVIATRSRKPCWISLEEYMACGVGACYGCSVATKSGYQRVCKEGPVFPAGEVIFNDFS